MPKCLLMAAIACGFGMVVSAAAQATTIDTFHFTQAGWFFGYPATGADPGGLLSGTFTGTVEPTGRIELGDLSSFSAFYSDSAGQGLGEDLSQLTLFSYDINGGASSFDVAGPVAANTGHTICVGAAAALDPTCAAFNISFPAGTVGSYVDATGASLTTSEQPVLTLESSVRTVPEPSSLAIMLTGLVALIGFAGLSRRTARHRRASRLAVHRAAT